MVSLRLRGDYCYISISCRPTRYLTTQANKSSYHHQQHMLIIHQSISHRCLLILFRKKKLSMHKYVRKQLTKSPFNEQKDLLAQRYAVDPLIS